ncbi:GntR family transcriptional regulator [Orbus sturtevantii]|uniref:GntR family transcriptional regulator n=1 Tax=Orbus sturtevantii TaxID=3074109 RepID=UPI00370D4479
MKFDSIYLAIKKRIYQYEVGRRLPSELNLASIFNVSRTTIRKALTRLKSDGVIKSKKGQGYFLIKPPSLAIASNLNLIEISPKIDQYSVLHFELLTATLNLSQLVHCNSGEKLFLASKALKADSQIKVLVEQYVPFNQYPSLSVQDISNPEILMAKIAGQPINEHTIYQIIFKPIKARLALHNTLNCLPEQIVQQALITATKLDGELIYFTTISYDPNQTNIRFNYQV